MPRGRCCTVDTAFNATAWTQLRDLYPICNVTRTVHQQFEAIVLGGARASRGMPSFKDLLSADQVRAIQVFSRARAKERTRRRK